MSSIVIEAIKQRRALTVVYEGHSRMVEPHIYGINSAGNEAVRSYQISGGSNSGNAEGWKELWISKLSAVTMTERTFVPRTSPSPWGDKPMRQVFAQV